MSRLPTTRRDDRRAGQPDREADRATQPDLPEHRSDDLRAAGAERDAEPDLPRPLRDGVEDDAVDADGGNEQRDRRRTTPNIVPHMTYIQ